MPPLRLRRAGCCWPHLTTPSCWALKRTGEQQQQQQQKQRRAAAAGAASSRASILPVAGLWDSRLSSSCRHSQNAQPCLLQVRYHVCCVGQQPPCPDAAVTGCRLTDMCVDVLQAGSSAGGAAFKSRHSRVAAEPAHRDGHAARQGWAAVRHHWCA